MKPYVIKVSLCYCLLYGLWRNKRCKLYFQLFTTVAYNCAAEVLGNTRVIVSLKELPLYRQRRAGFESHVEINFMRTFFVLVKTRDEFHYSKSGGVLLNIDIT
jgi:hypothetical protein